MPIFVTTIHTQLPESEVRRRLGSLIGDRIGRTDSGSVFVGSHDDESFKVVRVIRYRNSFLPVIRGRLVRGDSGTDVRLVMLLHPLVAAFMLLWCGGLMFGAARGLADSGLPWLAAWPLLICLFGIVVTAIGFFPEAMKAERLIRESVQGV